jgi:hypothetical protein
MGGYSVHLGGAYIGFSHASIGNQWNAYVCRLDALDDHLGRFNQERAVGEIVDAWRIAVNARAV